MQMLFCCMIRRSICTTKKWNSFAKKNTKQQQWEKRVWPLQTNKEKHIEKKKNREKSKKTKWKKKIGAQIKNWALLWPLGFRVGASGHL